MSEISLTHKNCNPPKMAGFSTQNTNITVITVTGTMTVSAMTVMGVSATLQNVGGPHSE